MSSSDSQFLKLHHIYYIVLCYQPFFSASSSYPIYVTPVSSVSVVNTVLHQFSFQADCHEYIANNFFPLLFLITEFKSVFIFLFLYFLIYFHLFYLQLLHLFLYSYIMTKLSFTFFFFKRIKIKKMLA